jgi:hypothetical protein
MIRAAFLGALALSPIHAFGDAALFGNKQGDSNKLNDCKTQCEAENNSLSEEVKILNDRVSQLEAELAKAKAQGGGGQKTKTGPNFAEGGERAFGPDHCGPKTYRYKFDLKQDGPMPLLEDRMPQLSGDPPLMEIFGNNAGIEKGDLSSCTKMTFFFQHWKNEESCKKCVAIISMAEDWSEDGHVYSYALEKPTGALVKDLASEAITKLNPPLHAVPLPKPHNGERHYARSADYLKKRDLMLNPMIEHKAVMARESKALLEKSADKDWPHAGTDAALVMCSNDGHLSLLINFFCTLRRAQLPVPRWVWLCCECPVVMRSICTS